ncbi:hypothetical protein BDY24DRAFT_326808, partial [Mrakia frigida]|uniref:uncharacterized protein n=1 Tax=Mrakia frigida TaxID=29902 RepID=UPI003FCBF15D
PTFAGEGDDCEEWVEALEDLFDQLNITSDWEKVRAAYKYAEGEAQGLIKLQKSSRKGSANWDALKTSMLVYYPSLFKTIRYTAKDLERFVTRGRAKTINSVLDLQQYNREFSTIALWLEENKKIA